MYKFDKVKITYKILVSVVKFQSSRVRLMLW